MPAGFTIPTIFAAIDRFSGPIRAMGNSVQGFVSRSTIGLAVVERGFRKLTSPISNINKMLMGLGYYVGLFTLIRLFKSAVDVMADFQQAQVNIAAVTGRSVTQNKALSDQARDLAVRYGVAATNVSELQYGLIKLGGLNVIKTTEASLTGATGLGVDPEKYSLMIGALIKSYAGQKDAKGMPLIGGPQEISNQLVKVADITALNGEDLMTMVSNSAAAAASAKIPFTQLLALFGATRDRMLQTASAGTALKNIFIDNSIKGKDLYTQLSKITSSSSELKKAFQLYNRKSAQTGLVAAQSLANGDLQKNIDILTKGVDGYAQKRASDQLKSLAGSVKLAATAYQELILTIEDGNGPIAKMLNNTVQTFRAMLLWASGSDRSIITLGGMNKEVVASAYNWLQWLNIIKWVIILLVGAKLAIIAYSVVVGVATVALNIFNFSMGLYNGLMSISTVYTVAQSAALAGQTTAMWLLNAAMYANPIGLIILVVASLIALVTVMIKKWNDWGAVLGLIFLPLLAVISLIQSFRRNWSLITGAFQTDGMIAGLKAIGVTILDAILMPLQQLLKIIGKITGFQWAADAAAEINSLRGKMGANNYSDENGDSLGPESVIPKVTREQALGNNQNMNPDAWKPGKLTVDFTNVPTGTDISGDKAAMDSIKMKVGSTLLNNFGIS